MVRVSIDLTDGETGFSTWSRRIDARLSDIFAFQSEVARTVSQALSVRMATQDPAPGGTRIVAAYEAYLRGTALYNLSKDEATDRQAKALFENAIALDPEFALAPPHGPACCRRSLRFMRGAGSNRPSPPPLRKEAKLSPWLQNWPRGNWH